jgi:hypothetical protein
MKCVNHPEADVAGYCRQCGKALCTECRRDVRGVIYCEDCLASTVAAPSQAAAPGAPNPGVALALGFIPGVGAIYNGEYVKALVHIVIFGGLISLMESAGHAIGPLLGMLLFAFYVYMPIDAYRTAKRRAAGLEPEPGGWESLGFGGGERAAPVGPLVLIVLGALFLMNTLGIFHWGWWHLGRFWPVILIALGAWLLWKRTTGASSGEGKGSGQ